MQLFKKKPPPIKGQIGHFGLADWWLSTFTDEERKYIEAIHNPLGAGEGTLTQTNISFTTQTVGMFLSGLSTWFRKPADRHIARRMLAKAEKVIDPNNDTLGLHFTYLGMIEVNYPDRDKVPDAFEAAIRACEKQIDLAPKAAKAFKKEYSNRPLPSHIGFEQLAIIREKQKDYSQAIRLSQEAKKQGWAGDWDNRIERCEKKLSKQG